uniref:Macaca fascicularis brain cDNA, clone: QmoA-10005 n=1 Tax=Macaca fascicularis TaxID=9541 RepID=I7GP50_MACFA|nr:unnamed protein product [Macaca fascicularis]
MTPICQISLRMANKGEESFNPNAGPGGAEGHSPSRRSCLQGLGHGVKWTQPAYFLP